MRLRAVRPLNYLSTPWVYRGAWCRRYASSGPAVVSEAKAFSKTLLLPKTSFPLWSDPSKSEVPYQERTCEGLYKWQSQNAKGPVFVLHDGPPYANGDLHMGHALNKILKDIINRFHVSIGRRVHYVPGWDCHGLPIENKALKELGEDLMALPAMKIREAAKATAIREIASQKAQFRKFGIMADWSRESTYRTLDHGYEIRQLRIFQKMVEKGLIYRHYRPVHYSPSSRSALAEAELVYKDDHVSHSVFVKFKVDPKSPSQSPVIQQLAASETSLNLLVWTTTPWTLTANMGIAVHEELKYAIVRVAGDILVVAQDRLATLNQILESPEIIGHVQGAELVGLSYLPIFSSVSGQIQPLNVIAASHVTSESGTGLVHCAPAHGAEDYLAFRALDMLSSGQTMLCHVDGAGKFSPAVVDVLGGDAGSRLLGKEVLKDGNKAVVDLLKEIGALVNVQRIKHRYPYDWKTDEPIIVTATSQWFANLDQIKDTALNALGDVHFFPPASRNRLESFIRSRSEWCISRQRVWGVPIPALHHIPTDCAVLDSESLSHILGVLERKGVAYWWEGPVEEFLPESLKRQGGGEVWRKGTDTMDVWFDSGTSWSMLNEMGVGRDESGSRNGNVRRFDADVCLEGSDQHRGWFQSQLLTAVGSKEVGDGGRVGSPYGTLVTHGMVLDQHGKKMSKSLGNIMSPLTIVDGGKDKKKEPVYGADVLRLWVATVEYWRDMSIGPTVLAQAAESMRKIRNSARFILGNINDVEGRRNIKRVSRSEMGLAELYVMHELYNLERTALDGYATYNFPKVINTLTNFANITLSSLYFDITKDCLYANAPESLERRAVVTVLEQTLKTMTNVLAPVLPHLAEEIHASWDSTGNSVFMDPWTPLSSEWNDPRAASNMAKLLRVRSVIMSLLEKARGDKLIKSSLEAEIDIILPNDFSAIPELADLLHREENFLKTLFIVSDAVLMDEGSLGTSSPTWMYTDTVAIPGCEEEVAVRVRPATKAKCPRCWTLTRPMDSVLCLRCEAVLA